MAICFWVFIGVSISIITLSLQTPAQRSMESQEFILRKWAIESPGNLKLSPTMSKNNCYFSRPKFKLQSTTPNPMQLPWRIQNCSSIWLNFRRKKRLQTKFGILFARKGVRISGVWIKLTNITISLSITTQSAIMDAILTLTSPIPKGYTPSTWETW